jgi:hypothetical protein
MTRPRASLRRARRQRTGSRIGYLVTWDVDSTGSATCSRLRRFVFGYTLRNGSRTYRYPGFLEREGVRYVGQSVVFVVPSRLAELESFLHKNEVDHVITRASVGEIVRCPAIMPS